MAFYVSNYYGFHTKLYSEEYNDYCTIYIYHITLKKKNNIFSFHSFQIPLVASLRPCRCSMQRLVFSGCSDCHQQLVRVCHRGESGELGERPARTLGERPESRGFGVFFWCFPCVCWKTSRDVLEDFSYKHLCSPKWESNGSNV